MISTEHFWALALVIVMAPHLPRADAFTIFKTLAAVFVFDRVLSWWWFA